MDIVNQPQHYQVYSVECIEITRHLPTCLSNAVKYLYRCTAKGKHAEDLHKAAYYLRDYVHYTPTYLAAMPIDGLRTASYGLTTILNEGVPTHLIGALESIRVAVDYAIGCKASKLSGVYKYTDQFNQWLLESADELDCYADTISVN